MKPYDQFGTRNMFIWHARRMQADALREMQRAIAYASLQRVPLAIAQAIAQPPLNVYRQPIAEGDHTLPPWHPHYDGRSRG